MRHIRIPLLVAAFSLVVTGMAFAVDLPGLTSWTSGNFITTPPSTFPGLSIQAYGGGSTGFGDVLISPLYDVRNLTDPNLPGEAGTEAHAQATLIAIVNTDPTWGVLARLRFREWKRSRECFDIDIPLTTNDVWVAQVVLPSGSSTPMINQAAGQGSRYVSTPPAGINSFLTTDLIPSAPSGLSFTTGALETGGTIDRCQYGYFEVIGEERIGPMDTTFRFVRLGTVTGALYATTASPPDTTTGPAAGTGQITGGRDVDNVLMGTTYIVRPAVAISHQFNMLAIANFAVDAAGIWTGTGSNFPTLRDSVQGQGSNLGAGGFDNLEGLLSKRWIDFQYVAQGAQGGYDPIDLSQTPMSTSVVVTFPTKWAHYCQTTPFNRLSAAPCGTASSGTRTSFDSGAPFTGWRETKGDQSLTAAQTAPFDYGEIITSLIYDRSEHILIPSTCAISPCTPSLQRLPYEVNIVGLKPITAYSEDIFDFRNNVGVSTTSSAAGAQTFYSGWAEFDISPPTGVVTGDLRNIPQGKYPLLFNFYNNWFNYYRGLPVIGIVMTEFYNAVVSGYYGNTVPWQYGAWWLFGATVFP